MRNLERDERATLLVEAGHEYHELMGVMLKTTGRAPPRRRDGRRGGRGALQPLPGQHAGAIDDAAREALRSQAAKRVAIQFHVEETVSWDHSKLGGAY